MAKDTKEKLLETAHNLFQEKGFNGVTMRDISNKSGVNKGLLHYYFKSKHAIFLGVFKIVSNLVFINLSEILNRKDIDFDTKIEQMVDSYFELFIKHPKMPIFVLSELSHLPDFAEGTQIGSALGEAASIMEQNLKEFGEVKPGDGFQLLLSVVSLCVFPFMAAPITKIIRPDIYSSDSDFIEKRKLYVKNFITKSYK